MKEFNSKRHVELLERAIKGIIRERETFFGTDPDMVKQCNDDIGKIRWAINHIQLGNTSNALKTFEQMDETLRMKLIPTYKALVAHCITIMK